MDKKIWNISKYVICLLEESILKKKKNNHPTIYLNFISLIEDSSLISFLSFRGIPTDYSLEVAELEQG